MQNSSEMVSFLVMVAIMFVVTALDALGRRRKKQEDLEAMAEAERLEEDGFGGPRLEPGRPVEAPDFAEYSESPEHLDPPEPLEATGLGSVADEIRKEGRRELREAAEAPPRIEDRPASAPTTTTGTAGATGASGGRAPSEILVDSLLQDPEGLRKAVLYREILGPPLASRETSGGWEDPTG